MKNNEDEKVEIFHRINRLKKKAGIDAKTGERGFIDAAAIAAAQEAIDEKEKEYPIEVKDLLDKLNETWKEFHKSAKDQEQQAVVLDKLYNYTNNIKDLTSTYSHDLMQHFSLSLRDFCEDIDVAKKEHFIIVQAHIDVMMVTYAEKLRDADSAKAEELKLIVAQAIKKYS